jgi:hypothetical protein
LDEISLACAITIHKSQGSEFPTVVIPLATQHYMLLQRNLIYTGIMRGGCWCGSGTCRRRYIQTFLSRFVFCSLPLQLSTYNRLLQHFSTTKDKTVLRAWTKT